MENQIILMRHGKPVLPKSRWIPPTEMKQWIDHYNRSLVEHKDIPEESVMAARSAGLIVASTASRALSSVQALGHIAAMEDAVFSEAGLPFALWRGPCLPPHVWAAFFRLLWLFGYARGADSLEVTKERARTAAGQLISMAASGPVLLVGHGIMNRLIGKELQAAGWIVRTKQSSRYWGVGVYGRAS